VTKHFRTRLQTRQLVVKTMGWPVGRACEELGLTRQALHRHRTLLAKHGKKDYLNAMDYRGYRASEAMCAKRSKRDDILWRCFNKGLSMQECAKQANCGITTAYRVIGGYS
jgi:Mor family transcriptional regulator